MSVPLAAAMYGQRELAVSPLKDLEARRDLGRRIRLYTGLQELGNVSAACKELGVSRSLYYQLRKRFVRYGPDGLIRGTRTAARKCP